MQKIKRIVGVDVSKATLDYFVLSAVKIGQVENTPKGVQALLKVLKKQKSELVVLEATGGYQNLLVQSLHDADLPVKVVNPRQVRDFAKSLNRLGKTDKLDAKTIAEFGASRDLIADKPREPARVKLSHLVKRRDQIRNMQTMERGHLEHSSDLKVINEIKEHLTLMECLLKSADQEIRVLIKEQPLLAKQDAIMQSIPGVGPVVSAVILSELPEITDIGRKQVAALVGVAPFNRDSGKYRGTRHIWAGRNQVRKALYAAMRASIIWNPVIKNWFEKFIAAGKAYKVAVIACVRKMLIVIRSMLIGETVWEQKRHKCA